MKFINKLRALFGHKRLDAEMAEEMREHLERRVEANVGSGMSAEEARYAARRQFGGVEQLKEIAREQRFGRIWEQMGQDTRYAVRALRRNPVFSLTAILTLMLGLGAATTVFTLVDTVIWRPLPYTEPERLVSTRGRGFTGQTLREWSEVQPVADRIEIHSARSRVLSGEAEAKQIGVDAMSPGLFELLGRLPAIGRPLLPTDAEEGNQFVALLSHSFWQKRFGGDPSVVGKKITLDDRDHTIIGVMPRGFVFPRTDIEVWTPLVRPATLAELQRSVQMVARLKPGVGIVTAREVAKALNGQLDRSHPQPRPWAVDLQQFDEPRSIRRRLAAWRRCSRSLQGSPAGCRRGGRRGWIRWWRCGRSEILKS